jgi:hypothetical protein
MRGGGGRGRGGRGRGRGSGRGGPPGPDLLGEAHRELLDGGSPWQATLVESPKPLFPEVKLRKFKLADGESATAAGVSGAAATEEQTFITDRNRALVQRLRGSAYFLDAVDPVRADSAAAGVPLGGANASAAAARAAGHRLLGQLDALRFSELYPRELMALPRKRARPGAGGAGLAGGRMRSYSDAGGRERHDSISENALRARAAGEGGEGDGEGGEDGDAAGAAAGAPRRRHGGLTGDDDESALADEDGDGMGEEDEEDYNDYTEYHARDEDEGGDDDDGGGGDGDY